MPRARWRTLLWVSLAASACNDPYQVEPGPKSQVSEAKPQAQAVRAPTAPANGFGDSIPWEPYDAAFEHAKADGMPLMLLVHASWCEACKQLKSAFFNEDVEALSQRFVMVNVDQDLEPRSLRFVPDGQYVPRVLFVDPQTGEIDSGLLNNKRSSSRYFYTPSDDLAGVMRQALSRHERS